MQARIRLGVIGLGRRWQRYRPVLEHLQEQVQVRAVCDHVGRRADQVARQLGCAAAGGPSDLLDRDDVDAVLLLDRQWYGLWPLERACRLGKPVFCAVPLTEEAPNAARLRALVQESGARVMMALAPCAAPSIGQLRTLLPQRLGMVRCIRAQALLAARTTNIRSEQLLRSSVALSLCYACRTLIADAPQKTVTHLSRSSPFATTLFEFEGGRIAQVTLAAVAQVGQNYRLEVYGGQGSAVVVGPRWVRWNDAAGCHSHRLALPSLHQHLLEGFLRAFRSGEPLRPEFDEACHCLAWQQAALKALDY